MNTPDSSFAVEGLSESPEGPNKLLSSALRHRWLILFSVLLITPLGYLVFLYLPPIYESRAKLLIWTQAPPTVGEQEMLTTSETVGKHLHLLSSELVLQNALEAGKLTELDSVAGSEAPLRTLRGMLDVEPVRDASDTLLLTATGESPEDLPVILNSIVAAYTSILDEDTEAFGEESAELMESLKNKFSSETEDKKRKFYDLRQKLQVVMNEQTGYFENPFSKQKALVLSQIQNTTPEYRDLQDRLLGIPDLNSASPEEIRVTAVEARAYLGITGQDRELTQSRSPGMVSQIPEIEQKIVELALREKKQIESVGENHPSVKSLQTELAFYEAQLELLTQREQEAHAELMAEKAQRETQDETEKDLRDIRLYELSLRRDLVRVERKLAALRNEVKNAEDQANEISIDLGTLNMLNAEIREKDELIRGIVDRLSQIGVLATNYTSTKVRLIDSPKKGRQVSPNIFFCLGSSFMIGCLVGLGLSLLRDWSEMSFRSPEEIGQRLGYSVLSRIPKFDSSLKPAKGGTCLPVIEAPASALSEAYRTCRTALLFSQKQSDAKVILVTSPTAGDGKSTTSVNLAISFAQGGQKVVLVDADLRRPKCADYMRENPSPGLSEFAEHRVDSDELVRKSELHDSLHFVSAGPAVASPAEFLDSKLFRDFIESLKLKFDLIIIDSPPVLPVADACSLASLADGILLVLKIRRGVALSSSKACQNLRMVDANILGIIVNDIERGCHYSDYTNVGYAGYGSYGYFANRYYEKNNSQYYQTQSNSNAK